jgi:hypothetical protein
MKQGLAILILVVSTFPLFAQDQKPVTMSLAAENKILKAENNLAKITSAEQAINVQYMDLQNKASALQKQFTEEQAKEAPARKAVDDAQADAWKESGLDKAKFDADWADFTFKPKVQAKAEAPAKK